MTTEEMLKVADVVNAKDAVIAELVKALRRCPCPRPANAAPDDITVEGCMNRLECGCDYGDALVKAGAA